MNLPLLKNCNNNEIFYANKAFIPDTFNGEPVRYLSVCETPVFVTDCEQSNIIADASDLVTTVPVNGNDITIPANTTFTIEGTITTACDVLQSLTVEVEFTSFVDGINFLVNSQVITSNQSYNAGTHIFTAENIVVNGSTTFEIEFSLPQSTTSILRFVRAIANTYTLAETENGFFEIECTEEPCTIKAYGENGLLYETAPFACPEYDCEDCFREITWGDCEDNQFQLFVKDLSFGLDEVQTEVEEYITSSGILTSVFTSIRKQYTLTIPYCCYAEFWGDLAGKTITVNNQDYLLSGLVVNEDNIDLTLVSYKEDDCCC